MADLFLLSSAKVPQWNVYPDNILTILVWEQTSSDGTLLLIIALVASRHSVFDYYCLCDLGAITVVFGSFLMAGLHVDQFLFSTGFCHVALSMCKHFCLNVCWGAGGG